MNSASLPSPIWGRPQRKSSPCFRSSLPWRQGEELEIRKFGTSNNARLTFSGKEKLRRELFHDATTLFQKHCREALDIYKKFLIRMDRVAEFLKVAEAVGIDKGDIPDLTKAPSSLLDALEQHLAALEGRKRGTATSAISATRVNSNVQSAVSALSCTSSAFGSAGGTGAEINGVRVDEAGVRRALEEEAAALNQLKERHLKEAEASTNPLLGGEVSECRERGNRSRSVGRTNIRRVDRMT
ncbi:uncharacterized protein LOC119458794 [Dermacentor silvarum]|uniref:uncharacterized protein LOC119458794 n=1 Tax=Dermacentor silvarum TaxID=543639 RepID=UPI0021012AC4|nr:uncharacterized protein LOC119458794 [Dermacentor silvarum]